MLPATSANAAGPCWCAITRAGPHNPPCVAALRSRPYLPLSLQAVASQHPHVTTAFPPPPGPQLHHWVAVYQYNQTEAARDSSVESVSMVAYDTFLLSEIHTKKKRDGKPPQTPPPPPPPPHTHTHTHTHTHMHAQTNGHTPENKNRNMEQWFDRATCLHQDFLQYEVSCAGARFKRNTPQCFIAASQ
jgi:hypothetical protein